MGAILILEFDLSGKQVDGDYRGMATIDGVVLKIARCGCDTHSRARSEWKTSSRRL